MAQKSMPSPNEPELEAEGAIESFKTEVFTCEFKGVQIEKIL